ncbi:MAG: glycosyltransferase family 2 protein [Acetatifactor sp.]
MANNKETLYIIIPAYNESENIVKLIDDWYPVLEKHDGDGKSRLIIINDGSKDNTYEVICACAQTRPLLLPLTKPNGGHGPTLLFGYNYAIDNNADYIFQTDSDGQTDPAEFEQFWECRDEYDAVIGSRPQRQDGRSRKFVEGVLLLLLRMTFGVRVPDSNAPFRLMKSELVAKYLGKMPKDFNLPNVMLTTYFAYFKEKVKFIDITFKPRQGGTNSINIKKIIKIGWKALGDFGMLRKHISD